MPQATLSESELRELEQIISSLSRIFQENRIEVGDINDLADELDSDRVVQYLKNLKRSSKPEAALREELLAGDSPLKKYFLGSDVSPEAGVSEGFVDYQVNETPPILFELKPPFDTVHDDEGNVKYLKRQTLDWRNHNEQVEKYQKENEYLILTDLSTWEFFSRYSPGEPITEEHLNFISFRERFDRAASLRDFLDRLQGETRRGELDDEFFSSLNRWVSKLEEVEFHNHVTDSQKTEQIVDTINKFIFVQTLDSYSVIDFRWIAHSWEEHSRKWATLSEQKQVERFLQEITEWFHAYYDTELFQGTLLEDIKQTEENFAILKKSLKHTLGLEEYQTKNIDPGITNYNFREINEDVFGKAYENYLAEIRKDQGIYYTPKYVTEYIVEDTVGKEFRELADEIIGEVKEENYDKATELVDKFQSITVLDPACGSGSFLIKSLRSIWREYERLITEIQVIRTKHSEFEPNSLTRSPENQRVFEATGELLTNFEVENRRKRVSKIILQHLYGNDLDRRALEVAKLNIWLESIKLAPNSFQYQNIPEGEGYVLPDLEWNLSHGDALVGMSIEETTELLMSEYEDEVSRLNSLRDRYIADPTDEAAINQGSDNLKTLRENIDQDYKDYLSDNDLDPDLVDSTVPFHWALQFWHVFTDNSGGFDVVIGNPPYVGEKEQKPRFDLLEDYSIVNECYQGRMDMLYFFVTLGHKLGNETAVSSMITTEYWPEADSARSLRREILRHTNVEMLLGFNGYTVFPEAPGQNNLIYKFRNNDVEDITFSYLKSSRFSTPEVAESLTNEMDLFYTQSYSAEEFEFPDEGGEWYGLRGLAKGTVDLPSLGRTFEDVLESSQGVIPNPDTVTKRSFGDYDNPDVEVDEGVFLLTEDDLDRIGIDADHELLRPAYRNSDIHRYFIDYPDNLYLLYTTSNIDIDQHPLIRDHLQRYRSKLDARREVESGKIEWYCLQWPRSPELFETPKIVYSNWGNDWQPYAVEDNGYYERRDITVLKPKDESTDLYALTALLNSSLSEYWQTEERSRAGYTTHSSLDEFPIPSSIPDTLSESAKRLNEYQTARHRLINCFENSAAQLKESDRSFETILSNDRQKRQAGNIDETWSTQVSFYPSQEPDELTKEFSQFLVEAEVEDPALTIYGSEAGHEVELFKIEFKSRSLLQLVYVEIDRLLDSRSHVDTLEDILQKTDIPIIGGEVVEQTQNIVADAIVSYQQAVGDFDHISIVTDVAVIDNAIIEESAKVDSTVFELYDIDREDIRTILDSIGVSSKQKSQTIIEN